MTSIMTKSIATTLPLTLAIVSIILMTQTVPGASRGLPSSDQNENNFPFSQVLLTDFLSQWSPAHNHRTKRMVFDSTCKGIYDRRLFIKLERLCEDCYNLYRKPRVATECRNNCFTHDTYKFCVKSLQLEEKEYTEYANKLSNNLQ